MDVHPWTKYEIARIRDEEWLLRAKTAMQVREIRRSEVDEVEEPAQGASWLRRLLGRDVGADQPTVTTRPV